MSPLKERWKAFGITVLDPWIILFFISTFLLSVILVKQTDVIVIATLTFLVSLFSGILGGIVAKRWDDMTEEKVIVTRGKSANRGLQLLLSSAISVERRVRLYLQRFNDKKYKKQINSEVIKTYFEEMIEECLSLEEKVINSIEDWTDILPDAEIKTVLNLIRDLKTTYYDATANLERVNNELQETRNKSEAELNNLREEKREITEELSRIKRELWDKSVQIGVPTISGSLITGSSFSPLSASSLVHPQLGLTVLGGDFENTFLGAGALGITSQIPKSVTVIEPTLTTVAEPTRKRKTIG